LYHADLVPVLDVGGTHATAALVDLRDATVRAEHRCPLDPDATADDLVAAMVACARSLRAPAGAAWGVAMPGPFDYERGIALFRNVGKFEALHGFDLGRALGAALGGPVRFLNDADAFGIGEWIGGAAHRHRRALALTLGTGVGSSFLDDGRPVHNGPDVPPGGHAYRLTINGRPLEDAVSRRAILARYPALAGIDVEGVADCARSGDPTAMRALTGPFAALGTALAPWVERFGATVVVVGGGISRSWDLIGPPLAEGLGGRVEVRPAHHPDRATLLGAALHAITALG
jgi:glucokinase